jgi:anti-sigma factor RsiW
MKHVTLDAVEQWHRGDLPASEVVAIARHLAACRECQQLAEPRDLDRSVAGLRVQVEEPEHPDLETELFAYVDGTLESEHRARVNEHLAECSICREDVADARALSRPRGTAGGWLIAIAALLVLALIGVLLLRPPRRVEEVRRPHVVTADPVSVPVLDEAVAEAVAARRALVDTTLVMPRVLRAVRGSDEVLRGAPAGGRSLSPVGVVVESRRPLLSWDAADGTRSLVIIYAGEREVTRSPLLRRPSWTPPALERGVTYTWEVQIQTDGELQIVPMPPAPPAQFHVLDERAMSALETARRQHAHDPLLLGVLYANAGLEAEARAELARVEGAEREIAQRHLRALDSWR